MLDSLLRDICSDTAEIQVLIIRIESGEEEDVSVLQESLDLAVDRVCRHGARANALYTAIRAMVTLSDAEEDRTKPHYTVTMEREE